MTRLDSVERAVADIAAGKAVVVIDDEDRENEGDLIFAAELATPELVAFMVRYTSGYLCVAMTEEEADRLDLPPMYRTNQDRHFRGRPGPHDPPAGRRRRRADRLHPSGPRGSAAGEGRRFVS